MIGIYSIVNTYNGKMYIGQSINISNRVSKHFQELRAGNHKNQKLQNSYNHLGHNYFRWEVLLECEKEELDDNEIEMIKKFDSVSNGYNLEYGGNRYKTLSEETKKKIAKWNIGRKLSEETKNKIRNSLLGKPGTPMSEERRLAQSKFMIGKKMRLGKTGAKLSEETKKKMSISKIGNSNAKGSKRTDEEKRKLSELGKKRKGIRLRHTDSYYQKRGMPIPNSKDI